MFMYYFYVYIIFKIITNRCDVNNFGTLQKFRDATKVTTLTIIVVTLNLQKYVSRLIKY